MRTEVVVSATQGVTVEVTGANQPLVVEILGRTGPAGPAGGGGGGDASWGGITGTLADQTDLQTELDIKASKKLATAIAIALGG